MIRILKYLVIAIFFLAVFIGLYLLSERILSRMVVEDKKPGQSKDIDIFIRSNGVHTDLVLPVKNEYVDWSRYFLYENTLGKKQDYQYIGIGWGDKGFYLNTPEWKDLTVKTAFVAMTGLGETALHVTYYVQMDEDDHTRKIPVSNAQYLLLRQYVINSIEFDSNNRARYINTTAQYGQDDAFYEAHGAYSLFFTCNTWTNSALKYAGVRCSRWTAFDSGLLAIH